MHYSNSERPASRSTQKSVPPRSTAIPARTRGSEPALGKLLAAVDAGRAVHFQHRGALNEPFTERTVEPWGVVTHNGKWYLVGHDVDRDAVRTFRLSRIGDDVREFGRPVRFTNLKVSTFARSSIA